MMDSEDWQPPTEAEMKIIEARRERSDRISKLMSGYLLKGYKMLGIVCSECDTILLQDRQGIKYCVTCSELDSDTDKDNPLTNEIAAKSMVKEIELSSSASEHKQIEAARTAPKGLSQHIPSQAGAEAAVPSIFSTAGEGVPTLNATSAGAKNWPPKLDHDLKGQNGAATASELCAKKEAVVLETDSDSGFPSLTETQTSSGHQNRKRHAHTSPHTVMPAMPEQSSLPIARLFEKIDWASKELKDTASVEYSIHLSQLIKAAAEAVVAVRSARM